MSRLTDEATYCLMRCADDYDSIGEDCKLYKACFERKMYEKLKHYEDLEEQGRLIELPCKVGDTVYYLDDGEIYYDKVSSIEISKEKGEYIFCIASMDWKAEDFGKRAFLSEAEVYEAELEEGDE